MKRHVPQRDCTVVLFGALTACSSAEPGRTRRDAESRRSA